MAKESKSARENSYRWDVIQDLDLTRENSKNRDIVRRYIEGETAARGENREGATPERTALYDPTTPVIYGATPAHVGMRINDLTQHAKDEKTREFLRGIAQRYEADMKAAATPLIPGEYAAIATDVVLHAMKHNTLLAQKLSSNERVLAEVLGEVAEKLHDYDVENPTTAKKTPQEWVEDVYGGLPGLETDIYSAHSILAPRKSGFDWSFSGFRKWVNERR